MKGKLLPLVFLALCVGASCQDSNKCEETKAGKCFTFHGRYRVYTGDGNVALWRIGTHRLLGVVATDPTIDDALTEALGDPDQFDLFGDFTVCPLAADIKGAERPVCVKAMRRLKRFPKPD